MENNIRRFKSGEMDSDELANFKREVDSMTDEELDQFLNNCEPDCTFSDSDVNHIQEQLNNEIKAEKRQRWFHLFIKVSAAIMLPLIICCGVLLWNNHKTLNRYEALLSHNIIIGTDNGESFTTVLPDGSKVSLGPKSNLSYNIGTFNTDNRQISFSGEGRFSIKKNPVAPFRLLVNDLEIKVLGTTFGIYAREEKEFSEIKLEEGSLQLISLKSDDIETLSPGETAVVNRETGDIEIITPSSNYRANVGQSTMYFKSSSLSDVAKEVELYYGKNILVGEEIRNIQFTGSLPTDNLSQVIFVLENTLNIHISSDSGNIMRFTP